MPRSLLVVAFSLLLLTSTSPLFAQQATSNGDLPEESWQLVEPGTTYLDLFPHPATRNLDETVTEFDPGTAPEGDFMGRAAFTTDGVRILLTNRVTNNVSVYDVSTMELLENIEVGQYPCYIECTDDYAIVPCAFADSVFIIDLVDYSTAAILPTGEQPWVVHVSEDGSRAYVATDIDNTLEIIDLDNLEILNTIEDVPFSLLSFSWNSESGRNNVNFMDFVVIPNSEHVLFSNREEALWLYDAESGELTDSITGLPNILGFGLSGDESTLVVANSEDNTAHAYVIDLTDYSITDSVVCDGHRLSTYQIGVNWDGTKCYMGVGGNVSALVDFVDDEVNYFSQTYTAFWVGVNADHSLVVSGQYRFSIIDFEDESIAGSYWGYSQWAGAVSPVDDICVGLSPLTDEVLYLYDFTDVDNITFDNSLWAGETPEADGPRRVAITSDGALAVATHVISDNATVIDLETMETLATIAIGDRVQDVAITPDDAYAVICGFNSNAAHILDLSTNEIVAEVPCGQRPMSVQISPAGDYAYVANVSDNTITVIELDGASSSAVATVGCGIIGVSWASYGVGSGMALTPDGSYLLVCASFDDQVTVIDAVNHTVVASAPVGDFPLQIAINDDSDRAVVTNYQANTYSYLEIDGGNSQVLASYTAGDHPLRVAYDGFNDRFLVGGMTDKVLYFIDGQDGTISGNQSYTQYGSMTGVAVDNYGVPIVMTTALGEVSGMVHKGDVHSEYPGSPASLAYQPDADIAAVPVPGPDWITFIEYEFVNHPPSGFALLEPGQFDTVMVDQETVNFTWEESVDPDPDQDVSYSFLVEAVNGDGQMAVQDLETESYPMDPYDILSLSNNPDVLQPFWWRVFAISGEDTVQCDEAFALLVDPGETAPEADRDALPETASIEDAWPNPFNSTVTIRFGLPQTGVAKLTVYDVLGREVTTLLNTSMTAGHHTLVWEAAPTVPSGVYWVKLEANDVINVHRIMYLK